MWQGHQVIYKDTRRHDQIGIIRVSQKYLSTQCLWLPLSTCPSQLGSKLRVTSIQLYLYSVWDNQNSVCESQELSPNKQERQEISPLTGRPLEQYQTHVGEPLGDEQMEKGGEEKGRKDRWRLGFLSYR